MPMRSPQGWVHGGSYTGTPDPEPDFNNTTELYENESVIDPNNKRSFSMAVGEYPFPSMPAVAGVKLATASAGIKKPGRQDVVLIELAEGSRAAGVFTLNAFCAAPVTLCREYLKAASPRYLVINSGNANACTGLRGRQDAIATSEAVAKLGGVQAAQVLPFSTGVIGEPLPVQKITAVLPKAHEERHRLGVRGQSHHDHRYPPQRVYREG